MEIKTLRYGFLDMKISNPENVSETPAHYRKARRFANSNKVITLRFHASYCARHKHVQLIISNDQKEHNRFP